VNKIRGLPIPHHKNTAGRAPEAMPIPAEVRLPMSMHAGAPAKPVVSVGDAVKVGQLIGEAAGAVSAPVHASVSGIIKSIDANDILTGQKAVSVVIASDGKQTLHEGLKPPRVTTKEEFLKATRDSGVVGLGGAGYPTAPKITFRDDVKLDYLMINGAECEPYITSDTRVMIDDAEYLWEGILYIQRYIKPGKILICVEENKPEPIEIARRYSAGSPDVEVRVLPARYPQGERKVMVYNVTGRIVPEGGRLHDVGCTVMNCSTVAVMGKYLKTGLPLISRYVTVDGPGVSQPKNVIAPIGAKVSDLFEFCGGLKDGVKKITLGGPMMGVALPALDVPIVKVTNAVLAFLSEDSDPPEEAACIRCGRCVASCPMRLTPPYIENAYRLRKPELLKRAKVNMCAECGCCSWLCPAKRRLAQIMVLSKEMLWEYETAKKGEV